MASPHLTPEHEAFRRTIRAFVDREVTPHLQRWEDAGQFDRDLYRKAAAVGLLGVGFPEALGGTPADSFFGVIVAEELGRCGAGGIGAGLGSHAIALPPIAAMGSDALKRRIIPPVLAGDEIAALAITEPSGGSDVANLRTRARRDGDVYVVDGTKTFITSGMRADVLTVAVRTGGDGMGGISLLVIDADSPGVSRTKLEKMGWWCSDTATIHLDGVRVPVENLIGAENQGFAAIMQNFNGERLGIAAMAYGMSQRCLDEATTYARARETFGRPLISRQVIRHKLVEMATRIEALRCYLDNVAWRLDRGQWPIAEVCMLKNVATRCLEHCAGEAVQIFGGAGYIRGVTVERIYRETKVLSIGGGAEEIMADLAARQLGFTAPP